MMIHKLKFIEIGKLWMSRKLWMSITASGILYFGYWDMIKYLYTFTDAAQIATFQSLSTNFFWALTTIWLGYLGINGVTNWANSSSSSATAIAESITEKMNSTSTNTELRIDPKDVPNADEID